MLGFSCYLRKLGNIHCHKRLIHMMVQKNKYLEQNSVKCSWIYPVHNSNFHHCSVYMKDLGANIMKNDTQLNNQDRIKLILSEHALLLEEGCHVPSSLTDDDIEELLLLHTARSREKFLLFLGARKYKREKEKLKKANTPSQPPARIIKQNKFFFRIQKNTIANFYTTKEIDSFKYNSPLIFDFDYEDNMSTKEIRALIKQLLEIRYTNKHFVEPFPIHFQNYNKNGFLNKKLDLQLSLDNVPIVVSSDDYINKFPKDRLCYLTPHASKVMRTYDHNAIYIIGAIVDKSGQGPLSFAKAKKQGIKMVKLPLDVYLKWKSGSKYLNLVTMVKILHDFKITGNWEYSFRHLSKRLLAVQNRFDREPDAEVLKMFKLPRNLKQ